MFFTQSGKIIKLNAQNKMGSQFCVSHIPLAPEIMGNIDEGSFNFFFWVGGGGGVLPGTRDEAHVHWGGGGRGLTGV